MHPGFRQALSLFVTAILACGPLLVQGCGEGCRRRDAPSGVSPALPVPESIGVVTKAWQERQQARSAIASSPAAARPGETGAPSDATEREAIALAGKLLEKGYPRLAASILRKRLPAGRSLAEWPPLAVLGRQIGDVDLFWRGKTASETAGFYWKRALHPDQDRERLLDLLRVWPAGDSPDERFFQSLLALFRQPGFDAAEVFWSGFLGYIPREAQIAAEPLPAALARLFPHELAWGLLRPDPAASVRAQMMRIADAQGMGFSLAIFKPLWPGLAGSYGPVILSWAYACQDFPALLEYETRPENCPWAGEIRDYLVALDADVFQKAFGNRVAALRIRAHGLKELEKDLATAEAKAAAGATPSLSPAPAKQPFPTVASLPTVNRPLDNVQHLLFRDFGKENGRFFDGRPESIASNILFKHFPPPDPVRPPPKSGPQAPLGEKEKRP